MSKVKCVPGWRSWWWLVVRLVVGGGDDGTGFSQVDEHDDVNQNTQWKETRNKRHINAGITEIKGSWW